MPTRDSGGTNLLEESHELTLTPHLQPKVYSVSSQSHLVTIGEHISFVAEKVDAQVYKICEIDASLMLTLTPPSRVLLYHTDERLAQKDLHAKSQRTPHQRVRNEYPLEAQNTPIDRLELIQQPQSRADGRIISECKGLAFKNTKFRRNVAGLAWEIMREGNPRLPPWDACTWLKPCENIVMTHAPYPAF
jgi:hypothetical protein